MREEITELIKELEARAINATFRQETAQSVEARFLIIGKLDAYGFAIGKLKEVLANADADNPIQQHAAES